MIFWATTCGRRQWAGVQHSTGHGVAGSSLAGQGLSRCFAEHRLVVLYLSSEPCDPCSSNYLLRCHSFRKLSTTSAERESLANGRARPSRRLRAWPQLSRKAPSKYRCLYVVHQLPRCSTCLSFPAAAIRSRVSTLLCACSHHGPLPFEDYGPFNALRSPHRYESSASSASS